MRLLLVTLLPVILLAATTVASPQIEDPVPTARVDAGASKSGIRRTLSLPDNVQASASIEAFTSDVANLTPSSSLSNGEDAASPTIDKTETVDQSPGPVNEDAVWDVTGSPRQRSTSTSSEIITSSSSSLPPIQNEKFSEEDTFPSSSDSIQSSSSHIEVSGILISIDGVPTTGNTLDPLDDPDAKSSSPRTSMFDGTISLGPIEISSILHQIISTSILQSGDNNSLYVNISDVKGNISLSSSIPVQQLSSSAISLSNDNTSQHHDIHQGINQVTRTSETEYPSSVLPEEGKYSIYHGPLESSNPYAHWDSDSEEQEHEMELQRLQELSKEELEQDEEDNAAIRNSGHAVEGTLDVDAGTPLSPSTSTPTTGRSYLLLLAGNSTIVRLRQKDFAKYLKLNLAARLSLEYDDVRVNRVVLAPPQLLVNVSVVTPSETALAVDSEDAIEEEAALDDAVLKEEEPLHMLAETNATLLELSGEEYHVVRLLSLRSHPSDKKLDSEEENTPPPTATIFSDRHSDIELVIYTAVGGACALVILATLFLTFGRYLRTSDIQWPWYRPKSLYSSWTLPSSHLRHSRMGDEYPSTTAIPPTVIYSGSFAARATAASSANSWVDEYQGQSGVILSGDAASVGVGAMKLSAGNPLYTDLEMGSAAGNVIMGHNAALYAETPSMQRHQSPSKLHIFSCKPGSIVIPAAMPTPHHQVRRNLQPLNNKAAKDTYPLDVRIREDSRVGHDNPNYQT